MTKGFLSSAKSVICDLIRQWFFSHSYFGDPDYFSSRVLWTLPPHTNIHKLQLSPSELKEHSIKATQNWWQLFWGWKTHCIHQQIKLHMDSSPACMGWSHCTRPGCLFSLCGFCQKICSSVIWAPLPWMKLRLYCLFWGNENKTQVPRCKRRYEEGKCGIQGCNKSVYSCAVCS